MKKEKTKSTDKSITTKNEHWNLYATDFLSEVLMRDDFNNPETPMTIYSEVLEICYNNHKSLAISSQLIQDIMEKEGMTLEQEFFILDAVYYYIRSSVFDVDMEGIKKLLSKKTSKLRSEIKKSKTRVNDLRDGLKDMVKKELAQFQTTLNELEPMQRLNVLIRLIPYVLPKVEVVHSEKGE